jgi:hypothetical protein
MGKDKISTYKNMFLISTISGILGVYLLYKKALFLGWILVGFWAVLAVVVRVLIFIDKK